MKNHCRLLLTSLLGLGASAAAVQAQSSRWSLADVGVVNSSISPGVGALNDNYSSSGATVSANAAHTFTGQDRTGSVQAMTFTGSVTASAEYGQLHSSVTGTVTNTYYNAANPVYFDSNAGTFNQAGSPDALVSIGLATFTDTLQFGGALQAGYQARYVFHLEGTNSGYGLLVDLGVNIAGHDEAFFYSDQGHLETDWSTQSYLIDGSNPQTITAQFSNQFVLNTYDVEDGFSASGTSNFSSTATLAGIEIVDAEGNPVSGVTVTSGSGVTYAVVPEPSALAGVLAGAGLGGVLLRRRQQGLVARATPFF